MLIFAPVQLKASHEACPYQKSGVLNTKGSIEVFLCILTKVKSIKDQINENAWSQVGKEE